jgi:hypothetical protein
VYTQALAAAAPPAPAPAAAVTEVVEALSALNTAATVSLSNGTTVPPVAALIHSSSGALRASLVRLQHSFENEVDLQLVSDDRLILLQADVTGAGQPKRMLASLDPC